MGGHVVAHEVGGHARHERVGAAAEQERLQRRNHLFRGAEPPQPHARAEDLGKRPRADDTPAAIERVERGQRLALEAQLAVGVVFEDQRVELVRERDQLLAAPQRLARPRRVVEVHDRIDELARASRAPEALEPLAHGVGDDALVVHRHVQHVRPVTPDRIQRTGEGRRLRDDGVARIHERAEGQRERLARAVGHHDVLGRCLHQLEELVLVADQLAQPEVALRIAVGHRLRALGRHHLRGGLDHSLVRERDGVRITAAELEQWAHGLPRRGERHRVTGTGGEQGLEG